MSLTAVNVTTTASELVAAKANRVMLIIQNVSDTDLYLKLDSSATEVTVDNGLRLAAGDPPLIITCNPGRFTNAVRGIHGGTGDKVIRVTQEALGD
jgi:hypothetical protein